MDFSLPAQAPNQEKHRQIHGRKQFAIYSLVPIDLESLSQAINAAENANNTCHLAPRADFSHSRRLRDVYDYHLQLRDEPSFFDSLYFIVAVDRDYHDKGLTVVHLDSSMDEDNVVGVGRCTVDMAASWGLNLRIGNMDWQDLKDREELEYGTENPDKTKGKEAPDSRSASTSTAAATTQAQSRKKYGWYSLVRRAVPINEYFQGDYFSVRPPDYRIQMLSNLWREPQTYVTQIQEMHPRKVAHRGDIHPQLLLIATEGCTSADAAGGAELVRLKWDGETEGMDPKEAMKLKPDWEILEKTRPRDALRKLDMWAQSLGL